MTAVGIIYHGTKVSQELRFANDDGLLDSAPVIGANAPNLPTQMHKPGTYRYTLGVVTRKNPGRLHIESSETLAVG